MKNLLKLFLITAVFVSAIAVCNQALAAKKVKTPTSVRASHILVETKHEADALERRLEKGANFEYLAQRYSKCPSGQSGGDLGFFKRGQMVKEFEDTAFSMEPGEVSYPVRTQFGWHIIKVTDKK